MRIINYLSALISKFLPLCLVLLSIIAYLLPNLFISIQGLTEFCLGVIFFLMGMSLSMEQILNVIKRPKSAFIGFVLKWTIMVGVTIIIAFLFFRNQPEIASGVILSGIVPSGTSANLYTFIAGGEVALSITMATMDTLVSPIITPSILQLAVGKVIPIEFWPLFINIIWVVLVPLFLGIFLRWKFPNKIKKVNPYTSVLSQLALFIIVLSVISKAQPILEDNLITLPIIFVAVFFQVTIPMFSGLAIAKLLHIHRGNMIAITFHAGICNTALSATLAMEHIGSLAAVPAIANMVVNLTIGAIVAKYYERSKSLQS